ARTALKPGAGMRSSAKKPVILSRLCSFPQPVPTKTTPTATRVSVGGSQDRRSAAERTKRRMRWTASMEIGSFSAEVPRRAISLLADPSDDAGAGRAGERVEGGQGRIGDHGERRAR